AAARYSSLPVPTLSTPLPPRPPRSPPCPYTTLFRSLEQHRVGGPGLGLVALRRGLGADRERGHRTGALTQRGAEAVGAGVAPADDHHVLARRGQRVLDTVALDEPARLGEVLHRGVDSARAAAGDRQLAGHARPGREDHRVEAGPQLRGAEGVRADPSDVHPGAEPGALGAHLLQPALEV